VLVPLLVRLSSLVVKLSPLVVRLSNHERNKPVLPA
jgi:hypothetical protein